MALPTVTTIREHIAWSYANLARADAALKEGASRYSQIHHIIRSKLYRGLVSGQMSMRSLYDDERLKMITPQACCYCGGVERLAVDHLIPRIKGGADDSDNLILACRSCNSSKGGRDMLAWMNDRGEFPSVLLLRRYVKIVARHCDVAACLDVELAKAAELHLPFDVELLPTEFPPLSELRRWVFPQGSVQEDARLR